ncbi:uncharacterized protein LOC144107937 isoform X2 [Amblyomma americanum]
MQEVPVQGAAETAHHLTSAGKSSSSRPNDVSCNHRHASECESSQFERGRTLSTAASQGAFHLLKNKVTT